jgi:hypothetical protein
MGAFRRDPDEDHGRAVAPSDGPSFQSVLVVSRDGGGKVGT